MWERHHAGAPRVSGGQIGCDTLVFAASRHKNTGRADWREAEESKTLFLDSRYSEKHLAGIFSVTAISRLVFFVFFCLYFVFSMIFLSFLLFYHGVSAGRFLICSCASFFAMPFLHFFFLNNFLSS